MVDVGTRQGDPSRRNEVRPAGTAGRGTRRPSLRGGFWAILAAAAVMAALVMVFVVPSAATSAKPSRAPAASLPTSHTPRAATPSDGGSAATPTLTPETPVTVVVASAPAAAEPMPMPSVASLVAQVEAAGIVPGPSWSWSMGDTEGLCGVTSGVATGCTSWSSGVERTVFVGSPSLALVAHEVANAETEQSALPAILSEVSTAAAGTSWSPTDAVASCLVAHFLGFQDDAAGSWQCPALLSSWVASHIHDTIATTQTTAICGTSSGTSSTLTFTASEGTLTVTSPSGGATPQVVSAGPR